MYNKRRILEKWVLIKKNLMIFFSREKSSWIHFYNQTNYTTHLTTLNNYLQIFNINNVAQISIRIILYFTTIRYLSRYLFFYRIQWPPNRTVHVKQQIGHIPTNSSANKICVIGTARHSPLILKLFEPSRLPRSSLQPLSRVESGNEARCQLEPMLFQ